MKWRAYTMTNAFSLPKMTITEKYDFDREEILSELNEAISIVSFYRTKAGEARCLFTDLGEEEYKLFIHQVHRHVALYDFVKSAIITIDRVREEGGNLQALMLEAIEYIKLKQYPLLKPKNNNL